jgi:UDP-4-amino-4,6-dideoxy-N-acetyl-beta-L-altrosamine N-acetyltransferase
MLELCNIRTVTEGDLPMLLAWRNHPSVRQFMFTQHEISLDEHLRWYEKVSQDTTRQLLIVHDTNTPIGYVQFNSVKLGGISHWGFYKSPNAPKGSGHKLGGVALTHAFSTLHLHKVCGQAIETNQASVAFHQSLGFQQEGFLREQHHHNGTYHSVVCFGLLAKEWAVFERNKEHTHANH